MRKCLYDNCHEFNPSTHNHRYCNDCKCKRKEENRKKQLTKPLVYDEETFELQENRKRALIERRDARNEWIRGNKTFAMFDIETTDLRADGGQLLCACIKPVGGKVRSFKGDIYLPEGGDDTTVAAEIRDALREYDYIVTWFGDRFDMPFMSTRLLLTEQEMIGDKYHIDLIHTSRWKFLFNSNRLQSVEEALMDGKSQKTRLSRMLWAQAQSFNYKIRKPALDYILDHCVKDVQSLEEIWDRIGGLKDLGTVPLRRY